MATPNILSRSNNKKIVKFYLYLESYYTNIIYYNTSFSERYKCCLIVFSHLWSLPFRAKPHLSVCCQRFALTPTQSTFRTYPVGATLKQQQTRSCKFILKKHDDNHLLLFASDSKVFTEKESVTDTSITYSFL